MIERSLISKSTLSYLRVSQILKILPIGRSTWWHWVSTGKAPPPVKLGPRITAWRYEDIQQLIESLDAGKEQSDD